MSLPRQILPGSTYLVSRRCTQRQFLLKPSPLANQIFLYCLAFAAQQTGVIVHAVCVLSNHYHAVVSDPYGLVPKFAELLHKYVAKCLNASYGRWENLWASEPTSYVRLEGDEDIVAKTVYALTNPVTAGLVAKARQWPGVLLWTPGRRKVRRPDVLFRENGPMPEALELDIVVPPGTWTERQWLDRIRAEVQAREVEIAKKMKEAGRSFLGIRGIRQQSIEDSPRTMEPRRNLSPRVAARNKWRRMEALQRVKEFVVRYREALRRWRDKVRDVVFPAGTYKMRVVHNVLCQGLSP